MRNPGSAGLYLHFPYCRTICSYCDFDRQAHGFERIPQYLKAIRLELSTLPRTAVHSVFFGGGTPSLMEPEQVVGLLEVVGERLEIAPGAEVTLEANPDDLTAEKAAGLMRAGVNRLSIGVQSFERAQLSLMRRRHGPEGAIEAYQAARAGGMENVSLDLMYGLPGLSMDAWRATLERAIELGPDHLSCYMLTLEPHVPMGRAVAAGRLGVPEDDEVADQYALAQERLEVGGWRQYEVSNWARPGRESRHNLTYWRDEPYLGVGAGAASSWEGKRYKNTPSVEEYLASAASGRVAHCEEETTDPLTALQDFLALGLRLVEGVDLNRFEARFGAEVREVLGEEVESLQRQGAVELGAGRLRIPRGRMLVANEVMARVGLAVERWWTSRHLEQSAGQPLQDARVSRLAEPRQGR